MGFSHEALGPRALTNDEMETLRRAGVLKAGTRNMVADPAAFGRLTAMLPLSATARITYEDLKRMVREGAVAQTGVETAAIEYAQEHAGEYIRGLRDSMVRDARAGRSRAAISAQRAVQEGVKTAIAKRQTVSELKTALFDALDDRGRDWHRVAQTEINNAIQHGVYRRIREVSDADEDQRVYKRPAPDACPWCKKLYLEEDGVTPRIFKMRELADSNFGRKARNWLPTIGSVHPFCRCQLSVVPKDYGFKKFPVAKEAFEFDSQKFKTGELIPDEIFDRLGSLKNKTRQEAILSYEG